MSAVRRDPAGRRVVSGAAGGTIRRRLTHLLALPAIVVALLLSVVAAGLIQDYRSSRATSGSVTLALAVQDLVREMQVERGITAGVLGGNPSFRNELAPARTLVDQQRASIEKRVGGGGAVESQIRSAVQQLDGLPAVRAATDSATAGRAATFAYFTDRIKAFTGIDLGLDRTGDDQLRRDASALQALQDLSEALAQERAFLNGVFATGGFARGEFVQFATMRATKQAALARFERFATPSELAASSLVFATGAARITSHFEQVAIDAADGRRIVVNPQSWWSGLTTVLDDLRQLQRHVGVQIQIRARALEQSSGRRILGLAALALSCATGSVYLATMASDRSPGRWPRWPPRRTAWPRNGFRSRRAGSRPARKATRGSPRNRSTCRHGPPRRSGRSPPPWTGCRRPRTGWPPSRPSNGDTPSSRWPTWAAATRTCIRRQLGFITSLEREEIDPAALANLFELDHLATRMRRNAASLLVLVGASSPRQWSSSVPVADVIRAAVSEVEEYRRVSLRRVDDALVIGTAVGSIAHLLAELIENGLTFSPPDTEVEVQGHRLVDGYLIAITDQGVGMTADDLRRANAQAARRG